MTSRDRQSARAPERWRGEPGPGAHLRSEPRPAGPPERLGRSAGTVLSPLAPLGAPPGRLEPGCRRGRRVRVGRVGPAAPSLAPRVLGRVRTGDAGACSGGRCNSVRAGTLGGWCGAGRAGDLALPSRKLHRRPHWRRGLGRDSARSAGARPPRPRGGADGRGSRRPARRLSLRSLARACELRVGDGELHSRYKQARRPILRDRPPRTAVVG